MGKETKINAKNTLCRKTASSTNGSAETDVYLKVSQNELQCIKNLNMRPETLKMLGGKSRGTLQDTGIGKDFLSRTLAANEIKPTINSIKIKIPKEKAQNGENLASFTLERRYGIYNNAKSSTRQQISQRKWAKEINRNINVQQHFMFVF